MKLIVSYLKIFLLFSFLGAGCRDKTVGSLYRIPLKNGLKNAEVLHHQDYVDSVDYFVLETTDSCLLGEIQKIERWKNLYYIRDVNDNLYIFDREGKFIRKIGRKGRGPEEYTVISDFSIDPVNGDIYLIDWEKMQIYSREGSFQRSVKIRSELQVCTFDEKGRLFFTAPLSGEIAPFIFITVCDREGKVLKELPGRSVACSFGLFNWIHEQSGKVYYKEELSDTVYYLDSKIQPYPYAWIDFGDYKFSSALLDMGMAEKWPGYYRLTGIYDFPGSIVLDVQRGLIDPESCSFLFDKRKGTIGVLGKEGGEKGFMIDGVLFSPKVSFENQLICTASAVNLVDNRPIFNERLKKIATGLQEDSNPVIAVFYMK